MNRPENLILPALAEKLQRSFFEATEPTARLAIDAAMVKWGIAHPMTGTVATSTVGNVIALHRITTV